MAKLNITRFFSNKKDDEFGLDQSVTGKTRFVLSDGSINVKRISRNRWNQFNIYHWITSISWLQYFFAISMLYLLSNIIFATIYFFIGFNSIAGIGDGDHWHQWIQCFFFSAQTITTVGYGGMHPITIASNMLASIEAFVGLMIFAVVTGSLYSRFSNPHTRIRYSEKIIVSPHEGKHALMFMIANEYDTVLMEVEATVNLSWLDRTVTPTKRRFTSLKLEVPKITLFATNWVVVHTIDEESPLYTLTSEDCIQESIQIFVLIKVFDDTFSQTIYSRKSYLSNDLVWGAKFVKPFYQDPKSEKVIMDLDKVGQYNMV